ncbi:CRISPR-associated endonuclease/helicase Cas3 [Streptacidiphilus sp. MAP12-16]|uniref:type I-G CRISPR-associated helicase/endonuclease Cas3g n=1 Tax=Streptacidiphilus sp. MAP12-16 TaxID=3156300 RepID=UPI0035186551
MTGGFEDFVHTATGHVPYAYQARLAAEGLPGLLKAPTGAGKTVAAVLPWLYRRLVSAPERTPRRLVYVLPLHSLADQTFARVGEWLDRLGRADEVGLHLLTGGSAQDGLWRRRPERTAILVGTHDMLLSRALMRGFADSQEMAPVSYGLLHTDTQWVFDEMHLLGPALPTSVQLQRLRDLLGTSAPTRTMWMSSTWDPNGPGDRLPLVELGDADSQGGLAVRLNAVRRIRRLETDPERYVEDLAQALDAAHVPGTQTVAVLNTVERARALHRALREAAPDREVVLIHPNFRAADRLSRLAQLADTRPGVGPGAQRDRIIVATQALEAGFDLSSRTLLTELAPWSSIVQRAGRCNREGEHPQGGDLLWCRPPTGEDPDAEASARWLTAHEGDAVTSAQLRDVRISQYTPPLHVLQQRDLLELFDTAAGADVSRWLCAAADLTVLVAWRSWETGEPADDEPGPGRDELCPAPLADLRQMLDGRAWMRDRLDGRWRRAVADDLRPGVTLLLDARYGGYLADQGWAPESRTPVPLSCGAAAQQSFSCVSWVSLDQHLMETEDEARRLVDALPGLSAEQREAVTRAARYHDLGKCHDVFQEMLRGGGGDPPEGLLAKSKAPYSTGSSSRLYFRHELVSALMLLHGEHWHGDRADPTLVTYLAAAHHGKVRISVRPAGAEAPQLLGVRDGDRTPPVQLSSGERFPGQSLRTAVFGPGPGPGSGPGGSAGSWTERALTLLDRHDLGPFRLAYLETLVRVADWRSSARHDGPVDGLTG